MASRKANILCKKPEKRKVVNKQKPNKRAKVDDDDDVEIIEDVASTVVIDDDDDDEGYAPLAIPLLPQEPVKKSPPAPTKTTKTTPKLIGKKKLIVVPVSSIGSTGKKLTAKDVLSSNAVKSALSSLKKNYLGKTYVGPGNQKATLRSSGASKTNKIVPGVDNKIKVKLRLAEAATASSTVTSPAKSQTGTPSGDHDYFSVDKTTIKPNVPTKTYPAKSPLKNNSSALNSAKAPTNMNIMRNDDVVITYPPKNSFTPKNNSSALNSVKAPTNINIMPSKDLLSSYPIPENLKIDLNRNRIRIGDEICTVNSLQYCGNQRMKVFVAATEKSPARTIVLRKMGDQNVKDMKNVATVLNPQNPAQSATKANEKNVTTFFTHSKITPPGSPPPLPAKTPGPLPPKTASLTQKTPGFTPPTTFDPPKTPVFVIKPTRNEKYLKRREEEKATRKLLDEISKAMDMEDKKSNQSFSSESSIADHPKERHGRRWTELNKLHSIAVSQSCPKRYKLLNMIFAMPAKRSIISSFKRVKVTSGVNSQMLYLFQLTINCFLKNDQPFAIIFDIVTFTLKNKVPEYCLIFYLKSLTSGVEQVAGFWAQLQTFSADKIATCIKEMISACQNVGINICCIIGDSKYLRVLNQLGATEKDAFFEINGRKIYPIFEPKDLLVSTRNTFFKHDVHIEGKKGEKLLASWRHIKDCVTFDRVNTYQQMPKIDDSALECEKHDKAKFSNARKVLSYKMGSCINGYICSGYVDKSALGSATFIIKINQVFNSFFGKSESSGTNCCLQKSKENSHLNFWSSSYEEVKQWKYINNIKSFTPQCQKCLLMNLKSLPLLWEALKDVGVTNFNIDKISTRPIEKFVTRLKKKLPKGKNISITPALIKALQTSIDSTISQVISLVNKNKNKDETLNDFIEHLTSSETYDQFIQDVDVRAKHEMSSDESDDEK